MFSFYASAKFKNIACIVNHHYQVFHVPQRFYSVNKSCSIIFQLHTIPDYVSIVYRLTVDTALGKINWCQTGLGNTQGVLVLCIPRSSADIFTHIYWKNIWEPCGDLVIMESVWFWKRYLIFKGDGTNVLSFLNPRQYTVVAINPNTSDLHTQER